MAIPLGLDLLKRLALSVGQPATAAKILFRSSPADPPPGRSGRLANPQPFGPTIGFVQEHQDAQG